MKQKVLLVALATVAVASQAQAVIVYDNLTAPSAVAASTSSLDLNQIWGDSVTLTSGGILDSFSFTIFNSTNGGANTNSILTATVQCLFFDNTVPYTTGDLQTTLPFFGGFNGNVNFGTGLAPGFFSVVTFNNLAALNITVGQNLFITQQVTASTGGSTRMGVVTFNPDTVGTGTSGSFYRQTGATEGLVNFGAGTTTNNIGYRVDVVPEPTSMIALAAGAAFIARRRRKN